MWWEGPILHESRGELGKLCLLDDERGRWSKHVNSASYLAWWGAEHKVLSGRTDDITLSGGIINRGADQWNKKMATLSTAR
jgi:hypothetical protein